MVGRTPCALASLDLAPLGRTPSFALASLGDEPCWERTSNRAPALPAGATLNLAAPVDENARRKPELPSCLPAPIVGLLVHGRFNSLRVNCEGTLLTG